MIGVMFPYVSTPLTFLTSLSISSLFFKEIPRTFGPLHPLHSLSRCVLQGWKGEAAASSRSSKNVMVFSSEPKKRPNLTELSKNPSWGWARKCLLRCILSWFHTLHQISCYNVSAARVVWWIYDRSSKMLLWPSLVESSPFGWVQRHIRICVLDRKIRRGKAKANALTWRRRWQFLRNWIGVRLLFLSSSLEPFGQEYLRLFNISPFFLFCHFCAFAGSCWAWTCCPTMPFQSFFWTTQGFVSPFARSRGARRWASQTEWKRLECAEKHWKLVCRFGRWNVVLKSGLIHRQNARSQQFWGLDSACTNEVQCFGTCRIASRDTEKNGRHLQHFATIGNNHKDLIWCKIQSWHASAFWSQDPPQATAPQPQPQPRG